MSRTYRRGARYDARGPKFRGGKDEFRCRHCKLMIGVPPSGGRNRNHCPSCLYSKHVDGRTPGDRASECGAMMAPIAAFVRSRGEHAIVHRCLGCGFERHNRIAADDNFASIMRLPVVEPRISRRPQAAPSERTA
jgi:hypothetical protein